MGSNMDDLFYLNVDALQEYYAMKYYKVYKRFPKYSDTDSNKHSLIWKIKLLNRQEKSNGNR